MNRTLVWDLPTRLFHLAFAASLTGAIGIGFLADDDHPLFQTHMLLGVVALFLLAFRIVMGIAGSRHARFGAYPLRPREIIDYFVSSVFSKTKRYAGNNPGSALAAVLMFLLVPLLFVSGVGLGGEEVGELHETLAWALLAVVVLHLAGIIWHTIRHRENIASSMVTGRKNVEAAEGISSSNPLWGAGFLLASGAWIAALFANHNPDSASVKLPVVGINLKLGENESEEHGQREHGHREHGQRKERHQRHHDDD